MIRTIILLLAFGTAAATDRKDIDVDVWTDNDVKTDVDVTTNVTNDVVNNVGTGDTVMNGGDVSVVGGSNRTTALSNNLGDVDINDCMGSTQFGTPLFSKQGLKLNWVCMAEFYLRTEKYELAAMAICNTEVRKEFKNETACREAHDFGPIDEPVAQPASAVIDKHDEDEEHDRMIAQQQLVIDQQSEQLTMFSDRLARLEKRPAPKPRVIRETKVETRPLLTEQQLDALRIKK